MPPGDKTKVESALERYRTWISNMTAAIKTISDPDRLLTTLIAELNAYKLFIDVDLIFDSLNDFLYRQKGQLKLDNTVIEEFLPWLCNATLMPEITGKGVAIGPVKAYSGVYFESTLPHPINGGGLRVRTKDQDFAISRPLWIRTSHTADFTNVAEQVTNLAYIATEIKTNLDKTMFQEATGTARDVKMAISEAKYFLVCDWLDMTPISTKNTPIDEVLLLRQARRIQAHRRESYNTHQGRQQGRDWYIHYLRDHPYSLEVLKRLVENIRELLGEDELDENIVLQQGYF